METIFPHAGIWSLVPPLVAITLALLTKEVISSLIIGIMSGALIYSIYMGLGIAGIFTVTTDILIFRIASPSSVAILIFLAILGSVVAVVTKAGGSYAYAVWATRKIQSKKSAGVLTVLLGLVMFIDDRSFPADKRFKEIVANFISLVEKGYYDGLTFHRVISEFMAQGGCPDGTGGGGPGYTIPCETDNPKARKHFRGTLSMAHAGKNTGGSQFFITFVPTEHLDGKHTAFGRVLTVDGGMSVLSKLERIDPSRPIPGQEPDKIIEMKVLRKRNHEYVPQKLPKR